MLMQQVFSRISFRFAALSLAIAALLSLPLWSSDYLSFNNNVDESYVAIFHCENGSINPVEIEAFSTTPIVLESKVTCLEINNQFVYPGTSAVVEMVSGNSVEVRYIFWDDIDVGPTN